MCAYGAYFLIPHYPMRNLPPFLRILPLVVVGILLGNVLTIEAWWVAVMAAVCSSFGYLWRRKSVGEVCIALSIVLWAMCATELRTPQTHSQPTHPTEHTITITTEPYTSGRWQRAEAVTLLGGRKANLLLYADSSVVVSLGAKGSAYGYLNPLPEGSYGKLMARRGFVGTLYLTSPVDWDSHDTATSPTIAARRVQSRLVERVERLGLAPDEEAVVVAMLLGARYNISPTLRQAYSRAGASHILAISGLHVGIVAMVVWWLCWLLPIAGRRGHIVRNLIASVVMILYATICGLSPSVVRATIMFVTVQMALCYGTSRSALNTLCGAVTIMLLANPNNLYDISFRLSVVAVVGILVGYLPMVEFFGGTERHRLLGALLGVVVVGLCSTLATLPLVAHTFSVVSLVGIFLNPIVILTAQIIVMGGLIWVSLPLEWLTPLFRWIVGGAAEVQNRVVEYASGLSWGAIECRVPEWIVAVAYGLMLAGIIAATLWKERKVWKIKS